jgi:hypothetical protein
MIGPPLSSGAANMGTKLEECAGHGITRSDRSFRNGSELD